MSLTDYVSISVYIDWDNNGDFDDPDDDVTAYALYPFRTGRGRASVNDEFAAGTGSFRLDNRDGRFSPFNSASPLYPNVLPGRPVKIEAIYNLTTYPLFRGRCTPVAQSAKADDPYVEFEMVDAFEELRLGLTNTPLAVSERVDRVIESVLDNIEWPLDLRELDVAASRLAFFTNHNRLPLNAIQLAAKHELGGRLFVGKDGKLVFKNRYAAGEADPVATLAGTFDEVDPQVRQEDLVDYVRLTYPRFALDSSVSDIFTLSLPLPVPANTTIEVEFEVNLQSAVGATNYVSPLVAGTDFEANSQADGSGTSKNAQVSIELAPPFNTGFLIAAADTNSDGGTLLITNSDSSTVYLTTLKVRGKALRRGEETNAIRVLVAAPIITGQTFNTEFEFPVTDIASFEGWASYQANARGSVRARPVVQLQADTDELMALLLGLELGAKLVLSDAGAPWLTQIDNTYVVEGIELEVSGPRAVRSTLRLFDRELALASFFKLSGPEDNDQDYSEIVSAVTTVGDGFVF